MKISAGFLYITVFFLTTAIVSSTLFSISQMKEEALRQAAVAQESHLKTFWELMKSKGREFRVSDCQSALKIDPP